MGSNTDKNIVDRRRKKPNQATINAIKDRREALQNGTREPIHHTREILAQHTQNVLSGAALGPMLVIAVTFVSFNLNHSVNALFWSVFATFSYTIIALYARSAAKQEASEITPSKVKQKYCLCYLIIGLVWAAFFAIQLPTITTTSDYFLYVIALLILTAVKTTSTFLLPSAAYFVLTPVFGVLAFQAARTQAIIDIAHFGFHIIVAAFFILLARKLHEANFSHLEHQVEKDALIAELEVANSVSDEARRRAEEANLAKSRFLASMSHELRTPLNAILGFSEIMKNGVMGKIENPQYLQYMDDIHGSGNHLLNLINEILDLSRIEAGRYDLSEASLALEDIVYDCTSMVQLKAQNKNISIRESVEANLPMVWADEKSIRQVVLNLLSNAVKFTPVNGEIVIKLGWTAGGGQYLSIVDNGTGIPEEEIPVVLSAFGQGSIAIKSAEQGTGLGLPIVQAIMKKHEGNFTLKSKLRVGTTVTCTFPAKRIMQSVSPVKSAASN